MPLKSRLFHTNQRLQACLTDNAAHLTPGSQGDHVSRIHTALSILDNASVKSHELYKFYYGPSTAAAVLAYKTKRRIINFTYQQVPDNIVGKMTIQTMDDELCLVELKGLIPDPPAPTRFT